MQEKIVSPCGTICSDCKDYQINCAGCSELEGKVYWTKYVNLKICPLYDCPVNKHKYKTCAECKDIPCKKWRDLKDPNISDKAFDKEIEERLVVLKKL